MGSITGETDARTGPRPLALFLPTLEIGGAERAVSVLAGALAARGENVDLVVGHVVAPEDLVLVAPGVRLVELGTRRVITSFRAMRRYIESERPEALLTNLTHANAMTLLTRELCAHRVRIVAVEHSTLGGFARHSGYARHRLLPLVARATYGRAEAVVAVSAAARADLARITRMPEHRIAQQCNAIPARELQRRAAEPAPHRWLDPHAPPVLVAAGSLRPVKGLPTLLRAFAHLRRTRQARLVILGEGPQRPRLERLIDELALRDDVLLPGRVHNPYPWIARSAGVVMTSRSEGLPTVLLEAMFLGRPVVAVDCPAGPREALCGGRDGRLVPEGDEPALVAAMAWALDARAVPVREELVFAHSPDRVAQRYLDLLRPPRATLREGLAA
jgi:glycosyltransferase involved in cell wall biosynthesis